MQWKTQVLNDRHLQPIT